MSFLSGSASVCCVTVLCALVLVAKSSKNVQNFEQIQNEFGNEELILVYKHVKSNHTWANNISATTPSPKTGITTAEPRVTDLNFEDEWLMPGFAAAEDLLLNRDKRAIEFSGDTPEIGSCLIVDTQLSAALDDVSSQEYLTFTSDFEAAMLSKCQPSVTDLTSIKLVSVDRSKSAINFNFVFPSTKENKKSAQCLRNIQTEQSFTIGSTQYTVTKDPLIENTVPTIEAAVCLLCPAQDSCLVAPSALHYCGQASSFAFGTAQGDTSATCDDDTFMELMPFSVPLGSNAYDSLYLSCNGWISNVQSLSPNGVALSGIDFDIIAVLWTDTVIRDSDGAKVFYQTYSNNVVPVPAATQAVLDRATNEVRRFDTSASEFIAALAMVTTWDKAVQSGGTTELATFQSILVSDSLTSYVMFFYNDIKWSGSVSNIVSGFRSNTQVKQLPTSTTSDHFNLPTMVGNTGQNGFWFYKVGQIASNAASSCLQFITGELSSLTEINTNNNNNARPCPCSKQLLSRFFIEIINDANRICYARTNRLCCYSLTRTDLLTTDGVSGEYLKDNPIKKRNQFLSIEVTAHDNCCVQSKLCSRYHLVRPQRTCNPRSSVAAVRGFGDPHIVTLDNKVYTFNGHGEYIFLRFGDFEMQMRTMKAVTAANVEVDGTNYGAFAGRDNLNKGSFQIEISSTKDSLILYFMEKDVTFDFYRSSTFSISGNKISLRRQGDSVIITLDIGLTMTVSVNFGMLNFEIELDISYKGQTSGLVGNFDGDSTNDIRYRNGNVLPDTLDDKAIFPVLQTWAITELESLFVYRNGLQFKDYNFPTFTPFFLSDATQAQLTEAAGVCGGTSAIFCSYDYIVTLNRALANNTLQLDKQVQEDVKVQNNAVPTISADKTSISVTVGQEVIITVTAQDEDQGDTVTINVISQPATGFSFAANTGRVASWTPANTDSVSMSFQATDNKGAVSPLLTIDITLCSPCSSRGTCSPTVTRPTPVTAYFRLNTCICNSGYSGSDCETEVDACTKSPCGSFSGTTRDCTDIVGISPSNKVGYTCSACPTGYTTSGTTCIDDDECATNNGGCGSTGTCSNTLGSSTCICNAGYRLINNVCVDIDECTELTHDCNQLCSNTEGSFTCSCQSDYTLNSDNKNCTKKPVPPAPACTTCTYGCVLDNCYCPAFQMLEGDNIKCTDVDECQDSSTCSQKCNNTDPGFFCSCLDGFKLQSDKVSCVACTGLKWGPECQNTCSCNGRGSCDSVKGCVCNSNWMGSDCTTDVDECTANPNICNAGFVCKNIPGSYSCDCPTGYTQVGSNCQDIDECSVSATVCPQQCTNIPGSHTCSCFDGYELKNGNCEDIDECATETDSCQLTCTNTPGSFNCDCLFGFQLQPDRKTCVKVPNRDACENFPPLNCDFGCLLNNSQPECFCKSGYKLGLDGKTCLEIDECLTNNGGCSDTCTDTPTGSFTCSCSLGQSLDKDKRTCVNCTTNKWGANCANTCDCYDLGTTECNRQTGCSCKEGFYGRNCNEDIDECATVGKCTATNSNSICVNSYGSFACICPTGYKLSSDKSTCEDINECSDSVLNICDQTCTNNDGSFICSCTDGFVYNPTTKKCDDINECTTGKHNCQQTCINTQGGFMCSCTAGYKLDADRAKCSAITACTPGHGCTDECAKIGPVDTCSCPQSKKLAADMKTCNDIDECSAAIKPCIAGNCSNTDPGFTCTCADGFKLQADGVTCLECDNGYFGTGCASQCTCMDINTKTCNKATGTCTCKDGYNGNNCTNNIVECTDTPNICISTPNSVCKDTIGSYICECNDGFVFSNGSCQVCDDTHFGKNCAETCGCKDGNTESCNKQSGACICITNTWMGPTCEADVDECTTGTPCSAVSNSNCTNLIGGFECNCNNGYTKTGPMTCENTNECLTNSAICTGVGEVCEDTEGSFQCNCQSGYIKNNNACQDVDECVVNNGGCSDTCTNEIGSFKCSCPSGKELNNRDKRTCYVISGASTVSFTVQLNITDRNDDVNNKNSFGYRQLSAEIATGIFIHINKYNDNGVVDVTVISLRIGSVIADINILSINQTSSQASVVSKSLYDLLLGNAVLNVEASPHSVITITKDGTTFNNASSRCEILKEIKACESNEICEVNNLNFPVCRVLDSGITLETVLGLSIGLPLVLIVAAILGCIIYFCIKRRNRNRSQSSDRAFRSEPRDPFRSVFSGQIPVRGGWAASKYGLYSPDTLSAASSDSDGKLIKSRQKPGRMDFRDSAWNDNRSFASPHAPQDEGPSSNFSWEYMFRALEPMRNFEIQRPAVYGNSSPSTLFPARGRRHDSAA